MDAVEGSSSSLAFIQVGGHGVLGPSSITNKQSSSSLLLLLSSKQQNKNQAAKNIMLKKKGTPVDKDAGNILRLLSPLNPYMLFVYPIAFIFAVDFFKLGPSYQ